MSLLFDRPLRTQDCDIDTSYPEISTNPRIRAWDEVFVMFIRLAKLQGQLYNELYSLSASKNPVSKKLDCVDKLLVALQRWKSDLDSVCNALLWQTKILYNSANQRRSIQVKLITRRSLSYPGDTGSSSTIRR